VVHLKIDDDRSVKPVHDVVVTVPGKKTPNQRVMVGGHYDAWTYGTNDNGTGATNALEFAHSLAKLQQQGMGPDRTIEVNLWDAEEFGMMGSTEYAEDQGKKLNNVVGYLNMDVAGGNSFDADAVPSLDQLILDASKQVIWPYTGKSVYDSWSDKVGRLGSGSDYSAYIDHFGVPTASLGAGSPGGQYHTAFDDNYNEDHFLDPGHLGQAGLTRVIGLVALRLADANVPQFNYANYATQVNTYLDGLKSAQKDKFGRQVLDLSGARTAADQWKTAATNLNQHTDGLLRSGTGSKTQYNVATGALMGNERALLAPNGLGQRSWFKHQIYATGIDSGYSTEYLPGIQDAINSGNIAQARKYTGLLTSSLKQAAKQLRTADRSID
jgi:N-acetylated-alpha-linked acidic dipeptidase